MLPVIALLQFNQWCIIQVHVNVYQAPNQICNCCPYFCILLLVASSIITTRSAVLATAMTCRPLPLPENMGHIPGSNHQYFLQWVILHVKIDFAAYIILNIKNLKNTHDWFNFIIFHLKIWATGKAYTCINLTQKVWLLIIKLQFNGTCIHAHH